MDINLIWPAEITRQSGLYPPLGLGYISAVLKEGGYKPKVIDLAFDPKLTQIKDLKNGGSIYGISFTTSQYPFANKIIDLIKSKDPEGTIICGGPHPSALPEEVLLNTKADIVVKNEGEYIFLELVECLEAGNSLEKIDGTCYRNDSKIIKTKDRAPISNPNDLPFPDQGAFPIEKYFELKGFRELSIISARGCPGQCTFCYPTVQNMFGRKIRFRSVKNIVDEIEFLIEKYKVEMIVFSDDTLTVNKKRMRELSAEIRSRDLQFFWRGQTRVNTVEKEMLKGMKKAGCYLLAFGVESGSQTILNNIRKKITVQQIKNAFKMCKEVGILTHAFLMVGNVGETQETLNETINLLKVVKPFNASVSITTPYPGSDLYRVAEENGLLTSEDWSTYDYTSEDTTFFRGSNLSYPQLVEAKKMISETQKKESEKLKDVRGLLMKEGFFLKIGKNVIHNPPFTYRAMKLVIRSMSGAGINVINPMKRQ